MKRVMKKRGLELPISVEIKGKHVENLKDYQTIHWFNEVMEENSQLRERLWPN